MRASAHGAALLERRICGSRSDTRKRQGESPANAFADSGGRRRRRGSVRFARAEFHQPTRTRKIDDWMRVDEFSFELPDELIAQTAAPRGTSRLLTLSRATGAVIHRHIGDLPAMMRAGDVLVVNDTRVFAARLLGRRVPSGGAVECLLLGAPIDHAPDGSARYEALVHPGQKLKPGAQVRFDGPTGGIDGEILERRFFGRRIVRLTPDADQELDDLVDAIGHVPLPPYIHRGDEAADRERYQTVYARDRGSVAAPTAGL